MQAYWTMTRRELAGFFISMTGYVLIAAAMFLMGLSFVVMMVKLQQEPTPMPMTEMFFVTPFFWLIVLLASPAITMRLFALEKASGTFETLMTTPVKDSQVVAAKFTAAMIFYTLMWLPLLLCVAVLQHYSTNTNSLDAGILGSTFIGILLLGAMFIALGCFASALTRSQTTAAVIAMVFGVSLFLISFLAERLVTPTTWQAEVLGYFALFDQMHDFARGMVDTRNVVFYVSLTLFFLFLTLRAVESRHWK